MIAEDNAECAELLTYNTIVDGDFNQATTFGGYQLLLQFYLFNADQTQIMTTEYIAEDDAGA